MNASITTTAEGYSRDDELFGHPKGLYVCFATELWERFSFYGMKYLLLLYLTKYHLFSDAAGLDVLGSYAGLVYALPVIGGLVADRYREKRLADDIGRRQEHADDCLRLRPRFRSAYCNRADCLDRPDDARQARQSQAICIPRYIHRRHAPDATRCHQPDASRSTGLSVIRGRYHDGESIRDQRKRKRRRRPTRGVTGPE